MLLFLTTYSKFLPRNHSLLPDTSILRNLRTAQFNDDKLHAKTCASQSMNFLIFQPYMHQKNPVSFIFVSPNLGKQPQAPANLQSGSLPCQKG